jgi:3-methylfumaryl-CoA hydratase
VNDSAPIKDWLGRTRRNDDEITLGAVQRLAATLDQDPASFRRGRELPESWYAILFGPLARQSTIGPDGHPQTGDFLPPLPGTRRMFAGRRSTFHQPLKIGDMVSRVSTVTRAEPKTGRTGPFTLVTVPHEISGPARLAVTEEQDLIYRAGIEHGTSAPQKEAAPIADRPDWSIPILLDPVLVFRYSALTFNAHRIHYDLPYTSEVEGYPALVMNGGLRSKPPGRICHVRSPPMRRGRKARCLSARARRSMAGSQATRLRSGHRAPKAASPIGST